MSLQSGDIQGDLALQRLSKRQRALSVLRSSDGPGKWTVDLIFVAVMAALASFLMERASVPESVASVLAWISAAVAIFGIQQVRIKRRLDAVIELLKLDESDTA